MKEGVVLLHGILRSKWSMALLANYLKKMGYEVLNLDYPSSRYDISSLAELIKNKVKVFANRVTKVHFVGHSMGGLVIRVYLNKYKLDNLGRVVMIGTPNGGSEVADFLKDVWIYKKLFGPAGQQLVTNNEAIKGEDRLEYELGIIAGQTSLYFFTNRIIREANDGLVSIENTKVKRMTDHIVIKVSHPMLIFSSKVMKLVSNFLHDGEF